MKQDNRVTVAITGASGAPYALRLIQCLLDQDQQVFLLISSAARVVLATEHGMQLPAAPDKAAEQLRKYFSASDDKLQVFGKEEWFSPVASGSSAPGKMVVCPCSTSTLSAIACGSSNTLIERAADVVMKERGQLILVPAPGFYHKPESIDDLIDFMVARVLDHLGLEQKLVARWGYSKES